VRAPPLVPLAIALSVALSLCFLRASDDGRGDGMDEALRETLGLPEPTESWLQEDAEERNHEARAAWIERMHRAPPDVDWRAVERENGLRQVARRRALRAAPPSSPVAGTWVERGSENQAGRVHAGRLSPDKSTLYAGSSLGGVWRGTPEGGDWTPVGDDLYGGAHWIEVLSPETAGDPDVLVVATDGGLVHRSTDGGASWEAPAGLPALTWTRRLLSLEDGSEDLFLVASNGDGTALWRSVDRGASFTSVYDLGACYGDAWASRAGGHTLFLATDGQILSSEDLGDTWTPLGTFDADSGRAELAGSEAGAPRLWVVSDSAHLYRSDDAGLSFEALSDVSDYWGELAASIDDADLFAWGGTQLYVTHDGGDSFAEKNAWYDYYDDPSSLLHSDIMGISVELDADGDEVWMVGTDGGLYRSTDHLGSVENLSLTGLRVSQYYSTLTSKADPDHIAAGAQDQGYQITNGVTQDDDLLEFDQALSGDYGQLTSGDGTHDLVYSVYPGFILAASGEDSPRLSYLDYPSGEAYVPWLPPIVADPDDNTRFYFPARRLYQYAFTARTGHADVETWSDQSFSSDGAAYLSRMVFSPVDHDRVYAATSDGRFFRSDDHAVTWTEEGDPAPDDNWYYGQSMLASSLDVDLVYVGGSGYRGAPVRRSTDGGLTLERWSDGIDDTLAYCLCEAPDGSGRIYVGTETTVYERGPDDPAWTDITDTTTPITTFWSCESVASDNAIRFATYGRGIWDYQIPASLVDSADTGDGTPSTGEGEGEGEGEGDTAGPPDTGLGVEPGGCACDHEGVPASAAGILLIIGALVARRRQLAERAQSAAREDEEPSKRISPK